jgi:hypothetical protein
MESLLACALGMSHQNLSPVSTSTDARKHYAEPSDDMSGRGFTNYEMNTPSGDVYRRGTLCFEKSTSVWEYTSSMIDSLNFEAAPDGVKWTLTIAARSQAQNSGTNPNSSSWTLPTIGSRVMWDDLTVYIKPRDEFTITSSNDNVVIYEASNITLDIADGTYTGYELAQAIAAAANADVTLAGNYHAEYEEETRRFRIWTDATNIIIRGTGDMNSTIGFPATDTTSAMFQLSPFPARPINYVAFAAGDKLGVSKISWGLVNNLDIESQDSESDLLILEPERNGFREVTGSIEIPRYKTDEFLKAVNGFTTYQMWVYFKGAAINSKFEEYNFYFPQIKFTNTQIPISGPEVLKQTLTFSAQMAYNYLELMNFAFGEYTVRVSAAFTAACNAIGAYKDGLYGGDAAGRIYKYNPQSGTISTSCDVGTQTTYSIKMYKGDLYVGMDAGLIYKYNGTTQTWSLSCDSGAAIISDLAEYADYLYALEYTTGRVIRSSGTTWSSSCDTTSTQGRALAAYAGSLYMLGSDGSTFTRVYKYNAATWTTSCSLSVGGSARGDLCVHDGYLYAAANQTIYRHDGTNWVSLGSMGIDIKRLVSFRGNLLIVQDSAGQIIYVLHNQQASVFQITSGSFTLGTGKPVEYEGTLFFPTSTTTLRMFVPIKDIMLATQNRLTTNPL